MGLKRFGGAARAVVIGASGGIGCAVAAALSADPAVASLALFSRSGRAPAGLAAERMDVTDEASVAAGAERCGDDLDLVVVATGMLHAGVLQPEKDIRSLDAARLAESFTVNAVGPALVGKHFLPRLARGRRAAFACLSARVGSISDNAVGGWYGYRASKAALNMILRNFAIELARKRPEAVVLALQPGTVDTALSRPFQGAVPPGGLFSPAESAARLLAVIDGAGPALSGALVDWRGERIGW
jgi:NAD(P)-dependent dehydrogenase (short-subunit alcohol dehydrogenase family)